MWQSTQTAIAEDGDARGVGMIRSTTVFIIAGTIVAALIAAMVTSWRGAGAVLVLGLGLTAIGFVVGLLFSVPRVASGNSADDRRALVHGSAGDAQPVTGPPFYALNTNLEQVSDWLTKIIVGVGLVEARRLADYTSDVSAVLAGELNQLEPGLDAAGATVLALGMVVGFPVLGFLLGFFSVRLYISRAMRFADEVVLRRQVIQASTKRAVNAAYRERFSQPDDIASLVGLQVSPSDLPSDENLDAPIGKLRSRDDLVARGQAAMLQGRPQDAVAAFTRALNTGTSTPELLLDYARALTRLTPRPWSQIVSSLEEALNKCGPQTPLNTRKEITWELLNAYLYLPPPQGFEKATKLAKRALQSYCKDDPYVYVYLSAAYGQAYAYWKNNNKPELAAEQVAVAKDSIQKALEFGKADNLGDAIERWLEDLTRPGVDDDLELLFTDHPELLSVLKGANDVQSSSTLDQGSSPADDVGTGGDPPASGAQSPQP